VRRARLLDTLERDIPLHQLTLLSTPAGYGKTTLLAHWAQTSRLPVAWLSLGDEDDDPERFLRYLLTAWEGTRPDIRESALGLLLGGSAPDLDAALTAFVNVANDLSEQMVFVLDDAHLLVDEAVQRMLTFLLDHLPPRLHFVLAGRGEPSLPLARYRARQELLELRVEELRFEQDETHAFLNESMGLDLTPHELAPLHTQLEAGRRACNWPR
jgi:LuxR family maltose regulon positive regulatory protein